MCERRISKYKKSYIKFLYKVKGVKNKHSYIVKQIFLLEIRKTSLKLYN